MEERNEANAKLVDSYQPTRHIELIKEQREKDNTLRPDQIGLSEHYPNQDELNGCSRILVSSLYWNEAIFYTKLFQKFLSGEIDECQIYNESEKREDLNFKAAHFLENQALIDESILLNYEPNLKALNFTDLIWRLSYYAGEVHMWNWCESDLDSSDSLFDLNEFTDLAKEIYFEMTKFLEK